MKKKNKAVYSAMDIAAYILLALNDKDIHINYLHLERWMYFVQSYWFFLYDVPLFQDQMYAADYGIVIPEVHKYYQQYGGVYISVKRVKTLSRILCDEDKEKIDEVLNAFIDHSSIDLVDIIWRQKPWIQARNLSSSKQYIDHPITNRSIREYWDSRRKTFAEPNNASRQFIDGSKRYKSKPKRYRIKPSVVRNFFDACTIMTCIVLGFRIDMWIGQNAHFLLVAIHLISKITCFIFIINGLNGNAKTYEEAFSDLEKKLRSCVFEEIN